MTDSFNTRSTLKSGAQSYDIRSLAALGAQKVARLPYSLKILLENLLRFEDGVNVTRADIEALLNWDPTAKPSHEISFTPARVIMQDFTGVPAVVDLAAMRDAIPTTSIRWRRPSWSSTTPYRSTATARPIPWPTTIASNSSATASATPSCAGDRPRSAISRSCRPTPVSCTR